MENRKNIMQSQTGTYMYVLAAQLSNADCIPTAWVCHQAGGGGSVTVSCVGVPSVLLTVVLLTVVQGKCPGACCGSKNAVCVSGYSMAQNCAARALSAKRLCGELRNP